MFLLYLSLYHISLLHLCSSFSYTDDVLFQAHMKFPPDYPYSPPSIRFLTKVWHPNVYEVSVNCKIKTNFKNLSKSIEIVFRYFTISVRSCNRIECTLSRLGGRQDVLMLYYVLLKYVLFLYEYILKRK